MYLGSYRVIRDTSQLKQIVEQLFGNFETVTETNCDTKKFCSKMIIVSFIALYFFIEEHVMINEMRLDHIGGDQQAVILKHVYDARRMWVTNCKSTCKDHVASSSH